MAIAKPTLKTCVKGHKFNKSSDCPICPICEEERKSKSEFLSQIGSPARRALESEGIKSLEQLSTYSERDLLTLHGMGKSTIPKLNDALDKVGLSLKKADNVLVQSKEIDHYISQFEPEIQSRLQTLRKLFFEMLPDTEERFRYKMPAYKVGNSYLYFAAYKNHIGFYPVYDLPEIENEIIEFRAKKTKDSLHFSHDTPLPVELVKKIIFLNSKK